MTAEKITILGFNQNSQKSLGAVTLTIRFGQLVTQTKFYVLDAHTSYKALLGRPWLHENHVVPSTLHQCMKYAHEGKIRRINGDVRPFGVHEISFGDAKYFLEEDEEAVIKDVLAELKIQPKNKKSNKFATRTQNKKVRFKQTHEIINKTRPVFGSSSDEEGQPQRIPVYGLSSDEELNLDKKAVIHLISKVESSDEDEFTRSARDDSDSDSTISIDLVPDGCYKDLLS